MRAKVVVSIIILMLSACKKDTCCTAGLPTGKEYTNSIGMKFVRIESGVFSMGFGEKKLADEIINTNEWGGNYPILLFENGDYDEQPTHQVTITKPFYMGAYEVTNAQYEQFDPNHRYIDHSGFTHEANEAVIIINWHEATAFCNWLSKKESLPYRLPTEAEWEYSCRAGTTTAFYTGDTLPKVYLKNPNTKPGPYPVSLTAGQTPPNSWGLYDMHGNVEEWCYDWYGPYKAEHQNDPVGYKDGIFRVSRSGSHETVAYYLRSSNRLGTLPEDKHWLIGFRVVLGEMPATNPLETDEKPLWAQNVNQKPYDWSKRPDPNKPYFKGPINYVKVPEGSRGPFYSEENHNPAITWCPNGDIFVQWMTTTREQGREKTYLAARLAAGCDEWTEPAIFLKPPDRCMQGADFITDKNGKIYSFNAHSSGGGKRRLILYVRTSTDNAVTWSKPYILEPMSKKPSSVRAAGFIKSTGEIILPVDDTQIIDSSKDSNSTTRVSCDGGTSFPVAEGLMYGQHPVVEELKDGTLMAFTRTEDVNLTKMPVHISNDLGKKWTTSPSEFPPVAVGQRSILRRLREGPLMFISFSSRIRFKTQNSKKYTLNLEPITIVDADGKEQQCYGMFAALSFDEGKTWPVKKLITPGGPRKEYNGQGHTHWFVMDDTHAEPAGYIAAIQSPDGIIHLISSSLHYQFNLAWLKEPMPAEN